MLLLQFNRPAVGPSGCSGMETAADGGAGSVGRGSGGTIEFAKTYRAAGAESERTRVEESFERRDRVLTAFIPSGGSPNSSAPSQPGFDRVERCRLRVAIAQPAPRHRRRRGARRERERPVGCEAHSP
jgi:hypothetical protein